jgi:hypothetical protein
LFLGINGCKCETLDSYFFFGIILIQSKKLS